MSHAGAQGWVVAVDGGGSKIAVAAQLVDEHVSTAEQLPQTLAACRTWEFVGSGSANPATWCDAAERLRQALTTVISELEATGDPLKHVLLSLAGAGRVEERQRVSDWAGQLLAPLPECTCQCMGDIEPLVDFWPVNGGTKTIAAIMGTGSIVAARNPAGQIVRAGGWGPMLGDECSGGAIGLAGLRAVAQALDSCQPEQRENFLVQQIAARLSHMAGAVLDNPLAGDRLGSLLIQTAADRTQAATFAACVIDSGLGSHDASALQILTPQIEAFAWQMAQVCRQITAPSDRIELVFSGGLAENFPLLRQAVVEAARQHQLEFTRIVVAQPLLAALRRALCVFEGQFD